MTARDFLTVVAIVQGGAALALDWAPAIGVERAL
jgi:hypothetical protein